MSQARILHFSIEDLHRTEVLQNAGYTVLECNTMPDLIQHLRTESTVDLICISESTKPEEGVLAAARRYSQAPVVLFRSSYKSYMQLNWCLEFPPLTDPHVWLTAIHDLVNNTRPPLAEVGQNTTN